MNGRSLRKLWYALVVALILMGGLTACGVFGRKDVVEPTVPPPPTETPLPALPTLTSTATSAPPTATPTAVPQEGQPEKPTLTPTPQSQPAVGGDSTEPVATKAVSYVVRRVPVVGDAIQNGSFEEGFQELGMGNLWAAFDNGSAVYAWADEMQAMHVSHDDHAQLMRVMGPGKPDRYVGIYQTVEVIAGETYSLTMHGLIRSSTAPDPNAPYGHRMQWAIDYDGNTNWYEVEEWSDTGWNDVALDDRSATMSALTLPVTATGDKLTLFIRGWTKWPILGSEAKYYVDGIFLKGPVPGQETTVRVSSSTISAADEGMPTTGGSALWLPGTGVILVLGFALWEVRKVWKRPA